MRKLFIISILLFALFPSTALAQSEVEFKTLNIQLWSEHDQPSMLVIYNFEVSDETTLPASIDIRVPRAGNITAVAFDKDGELLLADYKNNPVEDANWQVITIFVTERTIYHVEYYQPLIRNDDKRSFSFQWTGDYPVQNFDVEVQVPNDSSGVKTTPSIPFFQDQTFLSGGAMLRTMDEGDNYQLQLEYSRTSDEPSVPPPSGQAVEPLLPVNANTDGRVTLNNLPFVLGGFGALLILGALYYFLRNSPTRTRKEPGRKRTKSKVAASQIYCHECGARAQEGDRFCRICGSKLRG
jgi:hypothetical protein